MKKVERVILILVLFLPANVVFSQQQVNSPYSMILSGEPVLEDILYLSLESGIPFLSFAPPLAPGEVRDFLEKINDEDLSPPAMEAYYRILNRLSPTSRLSLTSSKASVSLDIDLINRSKSQI